MKFRQTFTVLLVAAFVITAWNLSKPPPVHGPDLPTSAWLVETVTSDQIDLYVGLVCNKFRGNEDVLDDCKLDLYMNWVRWGYKSTLLHQSIILWHERDFDFKGTHEGHGHETDKISEETKAYRVIGMLEEARSVFTETGLADKGTAVNSIVPLVLSIAGIVLAAIRYRKRRSTYLTLPVFNKGGYKFSAQAPSRYSFSQAVEVIVKLMLRAIFILIRSLKSIGDIPLTILSLIKFTFSRNLARRIEEVKRKIGSSRSYKKAAYKCKV